MVCSCCPYYHYCHGNVVRVVSLMQQLSTQCILMGCLAGEDLIGARAYRVIFAAISLPLATLAVAHFINHRCAGRLTICMLSIQVERATKDI